ncbi:S8 family peptidase [Hymenobacter seoulensis]
MLLPLRVSFGRFSGLALACLVLLLAGAHSGFGQQQPLPPAPSKTVVGGRLVYKLKAAPTAGRSASSLTGVAVLDGVLGRLGVQAVQPKFAHSRSSSKPGAVDLGLIYQVQLASSTQSVAAACQALRKTGLVEYAEPLYSYPPLQQPNDPLADSTRSNGQYHLKNIRAYRAWDVTQGDTSITIGIVDGGTRVTHEDLTSQIQVNRQDPIDGIDNDNDGYIDNYYGWDFADNDNDPSRDPSSVHGILVAGCAAAATNNGKGVAGVGYKCRFMPLKIYPSTPSGTFGGYEAIVYAADHGCKIINLSWGGVGARSQYEQDVITYAAVNRDAVVVAAAGNTGADLDFYPASYDHVLSVATVTRTDERSANATYSRRVDLSAPGVQILTVYGDTDKDYVAVGGSSFASPLVAGAAALVRTRFPRFTAAQVAAQLRRTTDNIDALPGNTGYVGRIGSGRLNVLRAVTEAQHSARVVGRTYLPSRDAYAAGDAIRLAITVQNLLEPLPNLTVTLTSLSPYLEVRQAEFGVGPLATLERRTNSAVPFLLKVAANAPLNTRAVVRYHLQDAATGYQEDQYETLTINPDYVLLNANDLALTLTSRGNVGYDGLGSEFGESVTYRGSGPLVAEGGLLVATPTPSPRVSDNVRNDNQGADHDFYSQTRTALLAQPLRADQEAYGVLRDSLPALTKGRSVGVRIRQRAYAWAADPHRDYVILEYQLTNLTPDTLKPLHAGLYMDWDLPEEYSRNVADWDSVRRLGYVYSPLDRQLYTGVRHLSGGQATVYSINNGASSGTGVRLADGFNTTEKLLTLSNGTRQRTAGLPAGADVSQVVGATLPFLAPSDSVVVAFAVLAAPSLPELQRAADAAAGRYQQVLPVRGVQLAGVAVYPNPTTGRLQVELPMGPATVQVLSAVGQVLVSRTAAGKGHVSLDLSTYPAGMYLVQIRTAQGNFTQRIVRY